MMLLLPTTWLRLSLSRAACWFREPDVAPVLATFEDGAIATVEIECPPDRLAERSQWKLGALIRRLVADGAPQCQVARDLGVGRSTVARAMALQRASRYKRTPVPTSFTSFEPLTRTILVEHPEMPATVIAERVGCTGR
jgi:hypothetical protein